MENMRFFIDTHDKENKTFPESIKPAELEEFYKAYEQACKEENVISLKIYAGFDKGRAFCINMAANEEAVFNVHKKIGLPYDTITEVSSISPSDLLRLKD